METTYRSKPSLARGNKREAIIIDNGLILNQLI